MQGCAGPMDALVRLIRGGPPTEFAPTHHAHLATCVRCREAYADALACAGGLVAAAGEPGLADPLAWERGLFLRLLAEQQERPRRAGWARLALRLGRVRPEAGLGEWWRWKRGKAAGASR